MIRKGQIERPPSSRWRETRKAIEERQHNIDNKYQKSQEILEKFKKGRIRLRKEESKEKTGEIRKYL